MSRVQKYFFIKIHGRREFIPFNGLLDTDGPDLSYVLYVFLPLKSKYYFLDTHSVLFASKDKTAWFVAGSQKLLHLTRRSELSKLHCAARNIYDVNCIYNHTRKDLR